MTTCAKRKQASRKINQGLIKTCVTELLLFFPIVYGPCKQNKFRNSLFLFVSFLKIQCSSCITETQSWIPSNRTLRYYWRQNIWKHIDNSRGEFIAVLSLPHRRVYHFSFWFYSTPPNPRGGWSPTSVGNSFQIWPTLVLTYMTKMFTLKQYSRNIRKSIRRAT